MQKKWFKAKDLGYGWKPVTWQGWFIIVLYIIVTIYVFFSIDSPSHSVSDSLIKFAPYFVVLTALLISICYVTGEKPRWRWDAPRKK